MYAAVLSVLMVSSYSTKEIASAFPKIWPKGPEKIDLCKTLCATAVLAQAMAVFCRLAEVEVRH